MRAIHNSAALLAGILLLSCVPIQAQQGLEFRASITGNRNDNRGKCTLEVVVDTTAEIEVIGDTAMMYNVGGGQPPRWVRFQCNAPMPIVPLNFKFSGIDGRGRQSLVQSPVDGNPTVIRVEDPRGGSEGYTFDLEWNGAGPVSSGQSRNSFGGFGRNRGGFGRDGRGGNFNRRMTTDEAIRACEDAVIDQALDRLRVAAIIIRRTAIDDGPGRRDWVIGNFETRRGRDRDVYRFQCSVDFDSGRVRSADFQQGR